MLINVYPCVLQCSQINQFASKMKPITRVSQCDVCRSVFLYNTLEKETIQNIKYDEPIKFTVGDYLMKIEPHSCLTVIPGSMENNTFYDIIRYGEKLYTRWAFLNDTFQINTFELELFFVIRFHEGYGVPLIISYKKLDQLTRTDSPCS